MSDYRALGGVPFMPKPARPAPANTTGVVGWMRQNLFSSPSNALLTLVGAYIAYVTIMAILNWAVFNAVFEAESRRECLDLVGRAGACWPGVVAWSRQIMYGLYPADQIWRINMGFLTLILWVVPLWLPRVQSKVAIGLTAVLVYPFLASYWFLGGQAGFVWSVLIAASIACFVWVWATALLESFTGATFGRFVLTLLGVQHRSEQDQRRVLRAVAAAMLLVAYVAVSFWTLPFVPTTRWGGFFLTLVISGIGIAFSLPSGILLALGRRCDMPVIRIACVLFIELFRSVPLITILFMFNTMLPLFLPVGVEVNQLLRAIVAVCLFAAAYMAEVIRGGLQAIPRGQYEAASAMGLGFWQTTVLIIMPQALKIMIPTIVGNFIGLFKDTTLVSIIGLFDVLNMARAVGEDTRWLGLFIEPFFAVTVLYFICCFAMSQYSINLERKLDTGPGGRR
ncbi:MAG: amino acid ABC transporter permease [Geminicoccaceae bacterium]|nr:MAG: amino acid ABC transporter permease [Geminicoccaceae bacterium]